MKSKYVMIEGLAFNEEGDMKRLSEYASQGWILEGIVGGFFYKLKKDKPQNIVYSLDYQTEANEEYFNIFKEAGWNHIISVGKQMHIFSAEEGTKPIYSDRETQIDKYEDVRLRTGKASLYSSIAGILLIGLLIFSFIARLPIFLPILCLLVIDIVIFVFNFMPYVAYNSRIKQIEKDGGDKSEAINNKGLWKLYIFIGIAFLVLGILDLIDKKYLGVLSVAVGGLYIYLSLNHYKKYKKS
ncbi:DUF2812 domain-containing protein [Clostridium sp. 'White wine YQ']|uniref:DUF2812 domain-containing protein n=1 Tax=Clostridium sp. 'White wine YQ' TaxID=3027474 RepID=UPI002366C658|nr:DUF2812 domain-containing protein [Clostridium sp. 'White wine YQ']MDD7795369.1 DUF2812 domain-containing protein [Clostridium sp. 'White wine YQ']